MLEHMVNKCDTLDDVFAALASPVRQMTRLFSSAELASKASTTLLQVKIELRRQIWRVAEPVPVASSGRGHVLCRIDATVATFMSDAPVWGGSVHFHYSKNPTAWLPPWCTGLFKE
jgi:hypothetical protein